MRTSIVYLLIAFISVALLACKDEGDGIKPKTSSQSSCLLISRTTLFGQNNWYEYDSKNRLIADSTNFQSTRYYYDLEDKLMYSIRPITSGRDEVRRYRYIGNQLKESILYNVQNNDSSIQLSIDYEVDNQNKIISITNYYYSGTNKVFNGKNTFEYNDIGDIAQQVFYFSNGETPSHKIVYEYSESLSDPTLNYILFQNILLNKNKKLIKKNIRFNYNSSLNVFSSTPSQTSTTEIVLNSEKKPELRNNNAPNGVLNYQCN